MTRSALTATVVTAELETAAWPAEGFEVHAQRAEFEKSRKNPGNIIGFCS